MLEFVYKGLVVENIDRVMIIGEILFLYFWKIFYKSNFISD